MKETCSNGTCHDFKDTYLRFYRSLPDAAALPLVERKFTVHRRNMARQVGCGVMNCAPLIEIQSRIERAERDRGFEYGASMDRQIDMMDE